MPMAKHTAQLVSSNRLSFGMAMLVAVALRVGFGPVTPSYAQTQAGNTEPVAPVFEVTSIRQDEPGSMASMGRMMFEPDGYTASHTTLRLLIKDAYGVGDNQIVGTPNWINSTRYEIEARIDSTTAYELSRLSEDQRKLAHQHMLQALLVDRFKLTLHKEIRELTVYSLGIAKNGPKLHESKPGDTYAAGLTTPSGNLVGAHMMLMRLGGGQIAGQDVPLENLVKQLSSQLHQIVIDRTGLTRSYDFNLEWAPDIKQTPMFTSMEGDQQGINKSVMPESSGPSIFTALQEQLGLKLESGKGPVEILVVDNIEKPTEN